MVHVTKHWNNITDNFGTKSKENIFGHVHNKRIINECKYSLLWLKDAANTFGISRRGVSDIVDKRCTRCYDEAKNTIVKYFKNLCKILKNEMHLNNINKTNGSSQLFESKEIEKIKKCKLVVNEMIEMRRMSKVLSDETQTIYEWTLKKIDKYVEYFGKIFNNTIAKMTNVVVNVEMKSNEMDIDFEILVQCARIVKACNWVLDVERNDDETVTVMVDIINNLKQYILKLEDDANKMYIGIDEANDEMVSEALCGEKLLPLEIILPDIANTIKNISNIIYDKLINVLSSIIAKMNQLNEHGNAFDVVFAGVLTKYLKDNDLWDNTMIVFTTDNGASGRDSSGMLVCFLFSFVFSFLLLCLCTHYFVCLFCVSCFVSFVAPTKKKVLQIIHYVEKKEIFLKVVFVH